MFKLAHGHWQWMNDLDPHADGELLFRAYCEDSARSSSICELLDDFGSSWKVHDLINQSGHPRLWSAECQIPAASGDDSAWSHECIGLPKTITRWFALVRHSTSWLGPRHGDDTFNPDKDAMLTSFLRNDGSHLVIMPINGIANVLTTLGHDGEGRVIAHARNETPKAAVATVLLAMGISFDAALQTVMDYAKATINGTTGKPMEHASAPDEQRGLANQSMERWYDAFSYCTWNGIGQNLDEEKIIGALDSLAEHEIDISNLIIDDNWQSLDYEGDSNFNYRWTRFDANKENFPQGLKHTISTLRNRFPHIEHIAVWHGIFGYWNGISPTGEVAKQYRIKEVRKQSHEGFIGGGTLFTVTAEDVPSLYDDFYKFLVSAGIDAVKTDVQFLPDYLNDAPDRSAMIYAYQDAWTAATQKHFHGRAISCMSQTPEILFHSLMSIDKPPYMTRNSDDFYPFNPSSHTWHIFCNAHNALLMQHLNVLPDWDMFQTVHEFAGMHAATRCLSGGPIYITDVPGQHNIEIIKQMTATAIRGRSIILRPEKIATTMEIYVKSQSQRFLRIVTTHQGASLLGLFNIGDRTRVELVTLSSFRDIDRDEPYIIRKHSNGEIYGPFDQGHESPFVPAQLDPTGYEILTAYPVVKFPGINIAVLGLLGKMSGAAVIKSSSYEYDKHKEIITIRIGVKAVGLFGKRILLLLTIHH